MAHPTLEYIRGLRKSLETKKAEIVGENPPSTMPGSEHDSKPDASAKEPDKETKDETMVPNSGLTTSGAGDDSKITHTNDLVAGEAALTPKKEPEQTGDADADVPGGKAAEAKTAEALAAEILTGVNEWYAAKEAEAKKAEAAKAEPAKKAENDAPSAGKDTAESLITDKGKEPEQTKDVIEPNKKDEVTTDAMVPATGEGSSGETAAAAKAAEGDAKEAECCKDGKCGKCSKCKAAAQKKAGALDMELTSDVLAKIAAVMLATEEGTTLAENVLAKAAGAEAAEKTLNFLREQNDLARKQAEYNAGKQDALALILKKKAQDAAAAGEAGAADAAAGDADGSITEIADTLDEMVEAGEITEDEADQVVVEIAQALAGGEGTPAAGEAAAAPDAAAPAGDEKKEAQAVDQAAAGDAAINDTVAVDPSKLDAGSVPQGDLSDITPEDVAQAIDSLVQSGDITEQEADQLVSEITDGAAEGGDAGAAGGDVQPEEIAAALQQAVENGEIKPEDVQQVLTELEGVPAPDAGADAGAAGAAGAAAADAGAAGAAAPAAAVPPAEEAKTAGAKLLDAIQAARAAKAAPAK